MGINIKKLTRIVRNRGKTSKIRMHFSQLLKDEEIAVFVS